MVTVTAGLMWPPDENQEFHIVEHFQTKILREDGKDHLKRQGIVTKVDGRDQQKVKEMNKQHFYD